MNKNAKQYLTKLLNNMVGITQHVGFNDEFISLCEATNKAVANNTPVQTLVNLIINSPFLYFRVRHGQKLWQPTEQSFDSFKSEGKIYIWEESTPIIDSQTLLSSLEATC